jgi:DMSO/TMAO reductase YedYZ molybdopterin-dependent catalytic subunit
MTIHGLLTILLAVLLLWHVLARRFILRIPAARDRRAFLRLLGVSLAGLVAWGLTDRVKAVANLPGANRRFTGSYERGSLTGRFPAVTWLFDYPQPVDTARWQLAIEGAVSQPLAFTYDDLTRIAADTATATLDCTGGWYSTQEWHGVYLGRLLDQAKLTSEARSITVESVSGYSRRFSLDQAHDFLLALAVAGGPLSHGHGFPIRLVVPGQRGFAWVKWVARIRVNETSHIWQTPVPLR